MSSFRIKGVVRFADRMRRELSGVVSAERKVQLRGEVIDLIRQVDQIVVSRGAHIDMLPLPTRRAYHFLANLDFNATASDAAPDPTESPESLAGTIRLVGVKSYWQSIMKQLAIASPTHDSDELHESIRTSSERIDRYLEAQSLGARDLTIQSRKIRSWLAFFATRQNFDAYVMAIDRARPVFEDVLLRTERFHVPAMIEFQQVSSLYKLRGCRHETRVMLPTPMIVFSTELFSHLANASLTNGNKELVMAATAGREYQRIQAELEALSGLEDRAGGVYRDLGASFKRINEKYFSGSMPRPRLTWSQSFTGRKFGHYDFIRDMVMISCSLDRNEVPQYVLDFVVYHELLHKKLGVDWRNGRAKAHTREFRIQERMFERYCEAEASLQELANSDSSYTSLRSC